MTKPEALELHDTDLDAAAGGATDSRHKDWIQIQSISQPINRSTAGAKGGNLEIAWQTEEGET